MHPRLRPALAALACAVLLVSCDSDEPTPPEQREQPEQAEVFYASDVPEGSSGSLVAAVDGGMVTCQGWGGGGCDTVYDVMSMTKQFTAAAILKLQMQGRLRVTDPIGRHLPDVPPDKRGITVHHLLTHTAGLEGSLGGDYQPWSRSDLVAAAFGSELRSAPGARYHYSNVGYSLLAAIVEQAAGMGYEAYLAKELFAPAGMTSTGYVLPDWEHADVAVEYDVRDRPQGRPFDHPWAADGPYWNLRGNGGLLSTAGDMYRWYLALEGGQVLNQRAKADLFRPRVREEPDGDTRYAYGWVVMDSPLGTVQWHNGGNGWSYGEVTRLPDSGAFVFWVTNHYRSATGAWDFDRVGPDLTERVVKRLLQ